MNELGTRAIRGPDLDDLIGPGAVASLARGLFGAQDADTALRATLSWLYAELDVPVAGKVNTRRGEVVLAHPEPAGAALIAAVRAPIWPFEVTRGITVLRGGASTLGAGSRDPATEVALGLAIELLEEALEAGNAVDRFPDERPTVARAAHELRAPLAAVSIALAEAAEGGDGGFDLVRRSQREVERLGALVDRLLDWSSSGAVIHPEPLDLVELTREAIDSVTLAGDAERIVLAPTEAVIASVDRDHMRAAIGNLLRNALTYAPSPSTVVVTVVDRGRSATISVLDGGPGLAEDEWDRVFEPFTRGRAGVATRGAGLGLSITRGVVDAHGGRVSVRSWDAGTVFTIEIPSDADGRVPADVVDITDYEERS